MNAIPTDLPGSKGGMRTKVRSVHMIGIGGSGMSGIAEVLLRQGYTVSGSDKAEGDMVRRLRALGATIHMGHAAANLGGADVVVKSTAISSENPEVAEAARRGVPIIPRAEMLAELMRLKLGVAVAGTHGKTTTTSLLGSIFTVAGSDPTVIIGGRLNAFGSNARIGEGEFLIAEADESDGSFLCLSPTITIITNVDADHLDHYKGGLGQIDEAFIRFANAVPFYGVNVICLDDPGVRRIMPRINRPVLTYGVDSEARLRATILEMGETSRFAVTFDGEFWGEVVVAQPGRHNVLNALAAIGVSIEAGLPRKAVIDGLAGFGGVGRRFEKKGEACGVTVIDDYGHHPAEIAATVATARAVYPGRRLVIAFQPHRFTRTQALFGEFCKTFEDVDQLLLTEIYPASEAPIPGVSGQSLAQGIRQVSKTKVDFFENFDALSAALPGILKEGDVFVTLGAGNIHQVGKHFVEHCRGA